MGCPTTTVKISSIVFNVILGIIAVGSIVWIAFNPDALSEELAIGCYIACSLIVVFSFLGCYAAIRESVCLTATCAVFLLVLAILQIIAMCIELNDDAVRNGIAIVERAWERNEMDKLQKDHECCGKSSAQDYVLLNKPIPASCYEDGAIHNLQGLFINGCSGKVQEYYDSEALSFAINSWILVAFEFLGFLLAVFLVINFRNKQRRMQF